jgi:hypothetical protein
MYRSEYFMNYVGMICVHNAQWLSRGGCIITGAIFTEDQKDSSAELAFKYAVYRINKDKNLLPNTTLVYDIQYVPRDDSFRTSKKGKMLTSNTWINRCGN